MKNHTQKRLEEFIREFCNDHNGKVRFLRGVFYDEKDGAERIMNFLSESIQQAVAEERARVVGEIKNTPIYKAHTCSSENADEYRTFDNGQESYKQRVLSSLDKPLTDGEK